MTNAYLALPSYDAVPHKIDNIRWTWVGDLLRDLGQEAAAERCYGFAAEHRMVAATLLGERQIGDDDDEAMRIAIDFGGPLPVRSAAE